MAVNTFYVVGLIYYFCRVFPHWVEMIDTDFIYLRYHWNKTSNGTAGDDHRDNNNSLDGTDVHDFAGESMIAHYSSSGNNTPELSSSSSSEPRSSGSGLLVGHPNDNNNDDVNNDDGNNDDDNNSFNEASQYPIDEENNVHRGDGRSVAAYAEEKKRVEAYRFAFRVFMVCFYFVIPFIPLMIWPSLMVVRHSDHEQHEMLPPFGHEQLKMPL